MTTITTTEGGGGMSADLLFSSIELLDLIEQGNERKLKPDALGSLFGCGSAGGSGAFDVIGKCFQINSGIYDEIKRKNGSSGLSTALLGTPSDYIANTKKNPNYNSFIASLALLLQLQTDEAEAFFLNDYVSYHIYRFNASNINLSTFGSSNGSSNNYKSVELLEDVRDYYFKQHQFCWKILQELLRIESDSEHVYYAPAVKIVANIFNKFDIVAFLVKHLKFLYKRSSGVLEHKKFSMFDNLSDFHSFLFRNNRNWASFLEIEIENLLDVFISLIYNNKCNISCEVFIDVLNVAKTFNFVGPSCSSSSKPVEAISFKYVVFFAVCFDFALSNTHKGEASEGGSTHPLFRSCQDNSSQVATYIETISSILHAAADSPSRSIVMLLWSLFVDFVKRGPSLVPVEVIRKLGNRDEQLKQQAVDCNGLQHFVNAVRGGLGDGNGGLDNAIIFAGSSANTDSANGNGNGNGGIGSDVNVLQYCDVLQDVLGAIISLLCNESRDFDGIDSELLLHVCVLSQCIFRQNKYLCFEVWDQWATNANGKRSGIVRLIIFLRDNQPHEPFFLFLLLNALVYSADSAKMALDTVLAATVHKCSWVEADCVEIPSEYQRPLAVGSTVRFKPATGTSGFSALTPAAGASGVVCSVDSRERLCLVRWSQESCDWWDMLIDALVGGSPSRMRQVQRLVFSAGVASNKTVSLSHVNVAIVAMNLLTTLLSTNRLITMIFFERRLELLQLRNVLTDLGFMQLYPHLADNFALLSNLKLNYQLSYERLCINGVDQRVAEELLRRVQNMPNARDSFVCVIAQWLKTGFVIVSSSGNFGQQNQSADNVVGSDYLALASCALKSSLKLLTAIATSPSPWPVAVMNGLTEHVSLLNADADPILALTLSSSNNTFFCVVDFVISRNSNTQYLDTFSLLNTVVNLYVSAIKSYFECSNSFYDNDLFRILFDFSSSSSSSSSSKSILCVSIREISSKLSKFGYSISQDSVDKLFSLSGRNGIASCSYGELLCLLRDYTSDMGGGGGVANVRDKSADEAASLLSGLALCGGSGGLSGLSPACEVVMRMLKQTVKIFISLEKLGFRNRCERWQVYWACIDLFWSILVIVPSVGSEATLQAASYHTGKLKGAIANHFFELLVADRKLLSTLVQVGCICGLSALQSIKKGPVNRTADMRSLLQSTSRGSAWQEGAQEGALPIDYSNSICNAASREEVDIIALISEKSLSLLNTIFALHRRRAGPVIVASVVDAAISVMQQSASFMESVSTFPASRPAAFLGTNYVTILAGMLRIPNLFSSVRMRHLQALATTVLINYVYFVQVPGGSSSGFTRLSSLIDTMGLHNARGFVSNMCSLLNDSQNSAESRKGKGAVLELLLAISSTQPLTLALLLGVSSSDAASCSSGGVSDDNDVASSRHLHHFDSRPEDSALLQAIGALLSSAESLYDSAPSMLAQVYKLLIALWREGEHGTLRQAALHLVKGGSFWESVTYPLTQDLAEPPEPSSLLAGGQHLLHDMQLSVIEYGHVFKKLVHVDKKSINATRKYCQQLLLHSLSLDLLSRERLGALFMLDASADKAVANKERVRVNDFYSKANDRNRPFVWIKKYMTVDDDSALAAAAQRLAVAVGVDAALLAREHFSKAGGSKTVVFSYETLLGAISFSATAVAAGALEGCCLRTEISPFPSEQQVRRWQEGREQLIVHWLGLVDAVNRWDHRACISASQTTLLTSWATFLELYVPRNPFSQHACVGAGSAASPPKSPALSSVSAPPSAPPSPSMQQSSRFHGDVRSYLSAQKILDQLRMHSGGDLRPQVAEVIATKCRLLVSMYHYQLNDVVFRTSDPHHSVLEARDTSRLSADKMVHNLRELDSLLTKFSAATNISNDDALAASSKGIKLSLLTSELLLLQGLGGRRCEGLGLPDLLISLFVRAVDTLRRELLSSSGSAEGERAGNLFRSQLSTELFLVAVELTKSVLAAVGERGSGLTDDVKMSTARSIVEMVGEMAQAASPLPATMHDYSDWEVPTLAGGGGQPLCANAMSRGVRAAPCTRDTSEASALVATEVLQGLLEIAHGAISTEFISWDILVGCGLTRVISTAHLFKSYQTVLMGQSVAKAAPLAGYVSLRGDVSSVGACWSRALDLLSLVVTVVATRPQASSVGTDLILSAEVLEGVCLFIKTFSRLLLLPFYRHDCRCTIMQLRVMRSSTALFHQTYKHLRAWKSKLPEVFLELKERVGESIAAFTTLLNLAAPPVCSLSLHTIAISAEEKKGVGKDSKRQQTRGGVTARLAQVGAAAQLRSASVDEYIAEGSNRASQDEFYTDFEAEAVAALLQLLALARAVSPEPFDAGPLCVYGGSSIFYYSDFFMELSGCLPVEGVVDKVVPIPGGVELEVVLRDGSRDYGVLPAAIVYTNKPLVGFEEHEMLTTLQDRAKALLAEQAGKGVLDTRSFFNTSHLLLLLHYYSVLPSCSPGSSSLHTKRHRDATLMAGQAAILLLRNLGHHLLGVRAGSHLEAQVELQLRQCLQYSERILSSLSSLGSTTCKPAEALERALHDIVGSARNCGRDVYIK